MATMGTQYGAIVHGRRADIDAASSVEARPAEAGRVVALVAVQGNLATPSLEGVKGAFARLARVSDGAAATLAAATPPAPYCSGASVVLLLGDVAHVATTGGARCYRERGGILEELAAGTHDARPGDAFVAASHAGLHVGQSLFTTEVRTAAGAEFRNDTLDAALESALAPYSIFVAVAAARIP